jgi:hypothetical protein
MHSASDRLGELARMTGRHRPEFDRVIAFDFYDGPENGLALYDSGHAVRFALLGESRSRMFRAYALEALDGNDWWQMAWNLPDLPGLPFRGLRLPSTSSEALSRLERHTQSAPVSAYFVAAGDSWMQCLGVRAVQERDLHEIRALNDLDGFRRVHRLVKERPRS